MYRILFSSYFSFLAEFEPSWNNAFLHSCQQFDRISFCNWTSQILWATTSPGVSFHVTSYMYAMIGCISLQHLTSWHSGLQSNMIINLSNICMYWCHWCSHCLKCMWNRRSTSGWAGRCRVSLLFSEYITIRFPKCSIIITKCIGINDICIVKQGNLC